MGISSRALIYDVCGGIPNGRDAQGHHPGRQLDAAARRERDRRADRVRRAHDRRRASRTSRSSRACRSTSAAGASSRPWPARAAWSCSTTAPTWSRCARASWSSTPTSRAASAPPAARGAAGWRGVCRRLARGEGQAGDVDLLANVANGIGGNTICALGDAAAWPMLGFLTKFRADFEAKLKRDGARRLLEVAVGASRRDRRRERRRRRSRRRSPTRSSSGCWRRSSRSSRSSPSPARTRSPRSCRWWRPSSAWRRSTRRCPPTSSRCSRCWSTRARSWCCSSSWS